MDFLAAAAGEFASTGVVLTARRGLASIEGDDPVLFVGVELSAVGGRRPRRCPMDALGRALGASPVPWPVNLVLLDIAQDPVATGCGPGCGPSTRRATEQPGRRRSQATARDPSTVRQVGVRTPLKLV